MHDCGPAACRKRSFFSVSGLLEMCAFRCSLGYSDGVVSDCLCFSVGSQLHSYIYIYIYMRMTLEMCVWQRVFFTGLWVLLRRNTYLTTSQYLLNINIYKTFNLFSGWTFNIGQVNIISRNSALSTYFYICNNLRYIFHHIQRCKQIPWFN